MDKQENNSTLDQIEDFLREMIERLEPIHTDPVGRGRPRILPAMCLWAGVVVCILRGWNSQLAIWRLLGQKGLWDYPRFAISDQAIYKRLEKGGEDPLKWLYQQVSAVLEEHLQPYLQPLANFASEVVAIDQSTLDKITRHMPLLRALGSGEYELLAGKIAGVFNIRLQQWQYVEYVENSVQNEKVIAHSLLEHIQRGALILMDMGFFSFPWFDQLTQEGYYWISRLRQKTSYEIIHTLYRNGTTLDAIIWLGARRADRARYAVRLVTFEVGESSYQYITNVLHPTQLSLQDIASLYARRWDIEMAFKLIKRELGLHLFWSGKPVIVLQQIWAVLLISQILHALQFEIAGKAGVDPFDVSLTLLIEYLPRWNDVDFVDLIVRTGRDTGFIRPSRRIRIQTPVIHTNDYIPPPLGLILVREARYAHRRSVRD